MARVHIVGGGLAGSEAAWQAASRGVHVTLYEMRRVGSLVMRAADDTRVPAGAALAVDRERFSSHVTAAIASHPLISIHREEITRIPTSVDGPVILATGPLT